MFGLGYVGAEDRLFIDGRAAGTRAARELSSFAGGSAGNRAQDHTQWELAPYREEDLQRQYDLADDVYGAAGAALQQDVTNYVAGINAYINEARINPLKMPGEYAAIGKPGPEDWKVTDVIATASLIGGIFGKGGGRELDSALLLQQAQKRFGKRGGKRVWADLRSAEDPEAPDDRPRQALPLPGRAAASCAAGGVAMPDRGTVKRPEDLAARLEPGSAGRRNLRRAPAAMSNALLVSGARVEDGPPDRRLRPADRLLRAAAPDGRGRARARHRRPRRDVRRHQPVRAARPRARLRLERHLGRPGHHRHLRRAAVRAGRVEADDQTRRTTASTASASRSTCWRRRTAGRRARPTTRRPGSETLHAERTNLGLVTARGTVHGKPVAFTKLRVTYNHEADSALGFVALNDPNTIKGPADFKRAASKIGFTFNWFYIDHDAHRVLQLGQQPGAAGADEHATSR